MSSLKYKCGIILGILLLSGNLVSSQWQEHPINCYTCEGSACASQQGGLNVCSEEQSCVTVFSKDDNTSVIARGCSAQIAATHASYCDSNTEKCLSCSSNGCNTAKSLNEYVTCLSCDSSTDKNCLINPNSITSTKLCHKSCMVALYAHNVTDPNTTYELSRSCLDDKDLDYREICSKEQDFFCKACQSTKCNLDDPVEDRLKCFKCDGNCEDPTSEHCVRYMKGDQCYFKFGEDKDTIGLGCRSDLESEDVVALIKNKSLVLCDGAECNFFDKIPVNLDCKTCDSETDENCATHPTRVDKSVNCAMPYSQCYSMVENGKTIRGCINDLSDDLFYECLTNSTKHCNSCIGKNCNEEGFDSPETQNDMSNLIGEYVEDPGLWQGVPLNCYTCYEGQCDITNSVIKKCIGNELQTCATVFNQAGRVIVRGCRDEISAKYHTYCETNPNDCFQCKSSGCNLAVSKTDYIDCMFCDSKTNTSCTFDVQNVNQTRKCHNACMTAMYPRTSEQDPSYNLIRTCLDDKDLDDRDACGTDDLCHSCSDYLCNTQLLPAVRKVCQHCSGDSCQIPTTQACQSYTHHEQCLIQFDQAGGVSEMGCKSDYDPTEIRSLLVSNRIFLCDEDNCNTFENLPQPLSCRLCNSRTDLFCATEPRNVATSTTCNRLPTTSCYTRLLDDGHTERGCLSSLNGEEFMNCYNNNITKCTICNENVCNDEIFPLDRLACHTCNSAEDTKCDINPKHSGVCLKYSTDQTCVTALLDGITHRGCSSELKCNSSDKTTCRTCNTANCNTLNLKRLSDVNPGVWQSLPLNCYVCSGDQCKISLTRISMCIGNDNQHCMTVFDNSAKVTRRGCSDDVEKEFGKYCDDDESSGKCFNCNSNGCNNASSLNDYISCIHCDSQLNKNCVQDLTAVTSVRRCNTACMVALRPRSINETSIFELSRSCLDDKDLDDRDSCGSDGSLCKSCTSNNCNHPDVFDDRLECNSCLDENCENPMSKKCTAYVKNDTCFILFDNSSSIKQMGCISEVDAHELEENLDKMLTCSGRNCNDFSIIPVPQLCVTCDSSKDSRCASNPKDVASVKKCSSLPHFDCFIKILDDGTTTRGCISELSRTQRQACLVGTDDYCFACFGSKCNLKVFPEDRLTCHKCNSLDDPNCQDKPDSSTVCPVYSDGEVCSSKLVNGVTYRGCGSDFICDDSDKQYCKMCNTSNCNVANLYKNNIGYPGNWQDLPINCYTCYGNECDNNSTTLLRKCENNNLQNCVTVFSMAMKVVQRGCSDTIYEGFYDHHCDRHPDLCTYCKSSGCNDAVSMDEYVNCLFCDSTTHPNCTSNVANVSNTRKCKTKCMTSLYPRSDDSDPAYELLRSCLDDKELDDHPQCENDNEKFCEVCEVDSCNKKLMPENRLSCLRCAAGDCENAVETICPAYRDNDSCFILFDNLDSIAQMGCKSDFDNSTLTALRKKMIFCEGDNCNKFELIPKTHKCLQCNSQEDPLCATNPSSLTNFTQCTNMPLTSCYVIINDGHTVRGCVSDLEMETIDKCIDSGDKVNCNICNTDTCNSLVYPEDRQLCYRCTSDNDENCQTNPSKQSACPIYQENDQCGVAIFGETTNRGCSSELSCNAEDRETCRICSAKNCNTIDLLSNYVGKPGQWQDLPLNCYTCEGDACKNNPGTIRMCDNNNLQKCETVFDSTDAVIRRGCSDDVAQTHGEYCDTHSGYCQQCKSSGCNNITKLDDYVDCVFCDSTTNPNCVLDPKGVLKKRRCNTQCMIALFPRSSEEDPSYELSRSCLDDKDLDDRQYCIDSKDERCHACSEENCNNLDFPSERHECWSCRGKECEDDAVVRKCISYHSKDQCYTLFDNTSSLIGMGCRSEYEHSAVADLIQEKKLLLCDQKQCNAFENIPVAQSCIVCNSAIDPRCATNPNLIINSTTCSQLPYTGCYTLINKDGHTERGCQSALDTTAFLGCHTQSDPACSTCPGSKCNTAVYPADRLMCQRCNSQDDGETCANSPMSNSVCPQVTADEKCVTTYKNGVTYRGCSSELSCDTSDKKTCRTCNESGCNTVNLEYVAQDGEPGKWQDLPIKCHTCVGDACKNDLGTAELCSNNNLQNCVTVFNADGQAIQRGCSDVVAEDQESYCEQNTDKCFRCNSNECNKATSPNDYIKCLSCDTSINSSCVKDLESLTSMRMCYKGCMTALYPRSIEEDPSYDTIRTCLDDKELANQDTCKSGLEDLCTSCDAAMCNKDNLPIDRHSCSHCSGDDCQLPRNETCSGYRKNDQCSLLLDGQNSIIGAGCKSDFTNDQVVTLIKAKRLFLCEGANCNTFESLPSSQNCFLCNSKTDPNCAIKPNAVLSTSRCSKLPYTKCYTRVLDGGATERGCLSDLEDNLFYDCLYNNSTKCSSCTGDKCNGEIYPEKRLSCHICDSGTDPNYCEANPNSISICPNYKENDVCVTSFNAGTTYRGCGADIWCDPFDRKKCRRCNTADGCNTINLATKQDDNFGKWQDLPLECFDCKEDNCNGQLGEPKKCEMNNEQDCSTVFDIQGKVIRRGCSDEIDEEFEDDHCDKNPQLCFNCKSNACNNATKLNDFTDCIYCDSNKNKTCITNPNSTLQSRKCHGHCMTALYPSDSSSNPAYDLIRTCLNDKEAADQISCKEPMCKHCEGDSCNTHNLPKERLSCHSCLNGECENPVSELCPLHKKDDKCFIRFDSDNSIAEMGCLSSFRGQEIVDILKTKRVFICETENCNTFDKLPETQKCVTCDSAEDVNCAINAQQIGTVNSCNELPYTNCYTKIAPGGTTHRGCLADLPADEFVSCLLSGGENCTHCIGNVCNKEIFPKTRLQCYSCTSDTDPDCEELPTSTSACPYVRDSEKCVTALSGNRTRTERGCSSQLLCDTTDKSTCRHCSSTGCNTLDLMHRQDDENHGMWQKLPLKCHDCIGAECAHSLGPAITCVDGDEQDCVTVFDEQGTEVLRRGCAFNVEDELDLYCRKNPDKCISCKSNECNVAWHLNEFTTCAYCNSETDASCVTRPNHGSFATRKCHKGCMAASFKAANGTTQVIRTCLDDKETQAHHQCSGESSNDCSSCTGEMCNLFNYPRDRLTCHVCMGTRCSNTVEEYCAAYVEGDKCFAKYDNDKVEFSGCSSDIDSLVLQEWKTKNQLHECLENNCNAPGKLPTAQFCVACDSSKNVECATKPSAVNETQVCSAPVNSCMMKITNTVTHRGCLNSLPYNDQSVCEENANGLTLCGKCTGDKCNSVVYPSNRRSCFVCNSDKDDKCVSDPMVISVCPNYSKDNQCVTKYEGSITERGCSTELTCNTEDADHCQICNTDGCNDKQLDNGVGTIIANNLLVTLLVATVSLMGLTSKKWF